MVPIKASQVSSRIYRRFLFFKFLCNFCEEMVYRELHSLQLRPGKDPASYALSIKKREKFLCLFFKKNKIKKNGTILVLTDSSTVFC